ncbi:ABC transporter substrate-binding protein [Nonomuraea thailandensis]
MRVLWRLATSLAALATLTACASSTKTVAEQTAPATPAATTASTFPVTVEHLLGTTTIKQRPQRIVTIGLSDHEPVLALGSKPVGVTDWFQRTPFTDWPWTKDVWGGAQPEVLGLREDGVKLEKLVALKPDLIFAMYSGIQKDAYDQLSQIAPVVAQPKGFDPYAATWQEYISLAARALGEEAKAKQLIQGLEGRFAKVRANNPQWKG